MNNIAITNAFRELTNQIPLIKPPSAWVEKDDFIVRLSALPHDLYIVGIFWKIDPVDPIMWGEPCDCPRTAIISVLKKELRFQEKLYNAFLYKIDNRQTNLP